MSISARKVMEIRTSGESFNLSHDKDLIQFLEKHDCLSGLNMDGCGLIDIPVEIMKKAMDEVKIVESVRSALRKDIKDAENNGDDYIQYYFY